MAIPQLSTEQLESARSAATAARRARADLKEKVRTGQLSLSAAVAVLAEAGLSFLGYGAPPSTPSWGRLLNDLQDYVTLYPLTVIWPGLAITITVLACNLFGDALREATDPRLVRSRTERTR